VPANEQFAVALPKAAAPVWDLMEPTIEPVALHP